MAAIVTKTGTLATSTDKVTLNTSGDSVMVVGLSGTHSGFTVIIEGSINGTTWFSVNAINAKNNNPEYGSLVLPTNATRSYYVMTGVYNQIRVRATARTSGSISVQMAQAPGLFPDFPSVKYNAENTGKQSAFLPAGAGAANVVVVSSGPGILHRISVTTAGATAGMIVYDNATTNSGTILYSSPATHALGTYELNMVFLNGITVRQAATTAAGAFIYTLF